VIPRVVLDNFGRMTKLILPTEDKSGAEIVSKAVKLSNSNVPVIVCNPAAEKLVTDEVRLTEISPSTLCTPWGIVTLVMATALTTMLPFTIPHPWSASRSPWLWISNPLVLEQVSFWAIPCWRLTISEEIKSRERGGRLWIRHPFSLLLGGELYLERGWTMHKRGQEVQI